MPLSRRRRISGAVEIGALFCRAFSENIGTERDGHIMILFAEAVGKRVEGRSRSRRESPTRAARSAGKYRSRQVSLCSYPERIKITRKKVFLAEAPWMESIDRGVFRRRLSP
jgi:hypothetical protein